MTNRSAHIKEQKMSNEYLVKLKERRANIEEAIKNVLEAGQEFQTRNGRVKQANLQVLQQQLASIENEISLIEKSNYTDTEIFVFRGCR